MPVSRFAITPNNDPNIADATSEEEELINVISDVPTPKS